MRLVYPSTPRLKVADGAQSKPAVTFHDVSGSRSGITLDGVAAAEVGEVPGQLLERRRPEAALPTTARIRHSSSPGVVVTPKVGETALPQRSLKVARSPVLTVAIPERPGVLREGVDLLIRRLILEDLVRRADLPRCEPSTPTSRRWLPSDAEYMSVPR